MKRYNSDCIQDKIQDDINNVLWKCYFMGSRNGSDILLSMFDDGYNNGIKEGETDSSYILNDKTN